MPFPEGDDVWLIVASRNGAAAHPAWLYNLAAHPDQVEVEVEGRKVRGDAADPQRRGSRGGVGADHARAPELRRVRGEDRSRHPGRAAQRPLSVRNR